MEPTAQVGFDINTLNDTVAPAPHRVGIFFNEEDVAITGFLILGKNSAEYQKAMHNIRVANIKRAGLAAKRSKKGIDSSTDDGAEIVAATVAANDRIIAESVIIGWFGFTSGGVEIDFDRGVLKNMLTKYPQWQASVLAELEEEANFTKA